MKRGTKQRYVSVIHNIVLIHISDIQFGRSHGFFAIYHARENVEISFVRLTIEIEVPLLVVDAWKLYAGCNARGRHKTCK